MLSRIHSIRSEKERNQLLRSRYGFATRHLAWRFRIKNEGHFRVMIVISKKTSKKKHDRAMLKRRIQAVLVSLKSKHQLPHNIDLMIHVKSGDILKQNYRIIRKEVLDGFVQLVQSVGSLSNMAK